MKPMWLSILAALTVLCASAEAGTFFVSQSGTGDGSSCTSARSVSWFNSSSNWGIGSAQISPGSTVYLCGTLSSGLTLQGSGSSGSVITIDGSAAAMNASFNSNNKSYWRIQNVTWVDGFGANLIKIVGGSYGTFAGNTADNISGDPAIFIAQGNTLPSNITISKNFLRTTTTDLGNTQMDIIKTEGSTNVVIESNHLEMRAGGAGSNAHDDCIQTYESGSSSSLGNPSNWTVRYNKIVMNSNATNDRSWMMLENLSGTNNIYGNLFLGLKGAEGANGISSSMNASSVVFNLFNNTFVSKNSSSNNVINMASPGTLNFRNNIVYTGGGQTALASSMSISRSYNLWYGSNVPSCSSTGELCGQAPKFKDFANNDFTLTAALPGLSLATTYNMDMLGNTRGADGVWDIGAYEFGVSTNTPTPTPTPTSTATPTATPTPAPTQAPTATPAPPASISGETLLGSSSPLTIDANDGVIYELGMKFSSVAAGQITAIRFYKSASEASTHTGKIYSSTGALLASVAFTNESASGWQIAYLATPLTIAAGTTYTVSVNTAGGYYVATNNDFAEAKSSTNLRTPIGAGVYGAAGAMPTTSWNNSNYFRDVVFVVSSAANPTPTPAPSTSDTSAPSVSVTAPIDGSTVSRNTTVTISAAANDNVDVTKVEFYVNGVLKCTDTTAAYTCSWTVPRGRNIPYALQAKAYDAAGNTRASVIVTVTSR